HAEVLRRVRELERAVHAVVVGEGERRIAELARLYGELLRQRGAVEERVRRVRMQLDVRRGSDRGSDPSGVRPQPFLLARPMRRLRLKLDRHTRAQWTASSSGRAKARCSSTAGSC